MCRAHRGTHRGTTQRRQRLPTSDCSGFPIVDDVYEEDCQEPSPPASTDFIFRSQSQLRHLLALPKDVRKQLINASVDERRQLYNLRKAEEKALKLACRNKKTSLQHFKGHRRKTCRLGVGKSGSRSYCLLGDEDIDAATEYAYASVHEGCKDQPVDLLPVTETTYDFTLWKKAIARSQLASVHSQGFQPSLQRVPYELRSLVKDLEKSANTFDALRAKFLRRHGKSLIESLDLCTEGRKLVPAPLAAEVSDRFLAACGQQIAKISPGFHGTSGKVHESICAHGLLIPGQDNDIKVVNGSAHGNGVYIAKLNNPFLSQGFARDVNKMFVCGVVDDAVNLLQDGRLGSFHVTKQSANVSHVGDAMVVFDSVRVAPLFLAEWERACRKVVTMNTARRQPAKRGDRVRARKFQIRNFQIHRSLDMCRYWAWKAVKHKRGGWLDANWGWGWRQFAWREP